MPAKQTKSKPSSKLVTKARLPKRYLYGIIAVLILVGFAVKLYSSAGTNMAYHNLVSCPAPHPRLQYTSPNATGDCVHYLQEALNAPAGGSHQLVDDGVFGKGTKSAVISYQRAHGLTQDGVVGTATWASLDKAVPPSSGVVFGNKLVATTPNGAKLRVCYVTGKTYIGGSLLWGKLRYTSSNPNLDNRHPYARSITHSVDLRGLNLHFDAIDNTLVKTASNVNPSIKYAFVEQGWRDQYGGIDYESQAIYTLGTLPKCR